MNDRHTRDCPKQTITSRAGNRKTLSKAEWIDFLEKSYVDPDLAHIPFNCVLEMKHTPTKVCFTII